MPVTPALQHPKAHTESSTGKGLEPAASGCRDPRICWEVGFGRKGHPDMKAVTVYKHLQKQKGGRNGNFCCVENARNEILYV